MTEPEFLIIFQALIDEYDPTGKVYGPARKRAIWEAFRHMPIPWVKRVIQACFESERQAPLKKDLLRISAELKASDRSRADFEARQAAEAAQENETPEERKARVDRNIKHAQELAQIAAGGKPAPTWQDESA
jgi:hypothetical protein